MSTTATAVTKTSAVARRMPRLPGWVMPLLTTAAMSLGGWSLGWCMGTETRVTRLEEWRSNRTTQDAAILRSLEEIKRDLKEHIRYHMTGGGR